MEDYTGAFDLAWLKRQFRDVEAFFRSDVRRRLLDDTDAEGIDPGLKAEWEAQLGTEQDRILAVWQPDCTIWEWRRVVAEWNPKFERLDPSGEMGVAVLRGDRLVRAWVTGVWT